MIFSIFRFFCTLRFQIFKDCPNHTSMEILFIQLSDDALSIKGKSDLKDKSESSHLVEGVVMFVNDLLHQLAEAIVDGQELLHRRAW